MISAIVLGSLFQGNDMSKIPEIENVHAYQIRKNTDVESFLTFMDIRVLQRNYPVLFHSSEGITQWDFWDDVLFQSNLIEMSVLSSFHFSPATLNPIIKNGRYEGGKHLGIKNIAGTTKKRIKTFKRLFPKVQLAVENSAGLKNNEAYCWTSKPHFIKYIVEKYDCGFTLDIAHAIISSRVFGYSVEEYFNGLPIERCREIHLSSIDYTTNYDDHNLPGGDVLEVFNGLVKSRLKEEETIYLVVEYYKDFDKLKKFYSEEIPKYAN